MKRLTLTLLVLLLVWSFSLEAVAQVHRIKVKFGDITSNGTAVAIGRISGREYLIANAHIFAGAKSGFTTKIVTIDSGEWAATFHGLSDTKGTTGDDLALVSIRSSKPWTSYIINALDVPAVGARVTIKGFPFGRWQVRSSTIVAHARAWGIRSTGNAQDGESGSAVLHDGKLVGLVWGSRVGDKYGTFSTNGLGIASFIRERFSRIFGTTSQVIFDPSLSLSTGRGGGISLRSPVALTVPGAAIAPECRIEVFSASWCGPCVEWKRTELGKVRAAGIAVEIVENDARARAAGISTYPTFLIIHLGREQARRSGFTSETRTMAGDLIDLFRSTHPGKPSSGTTVNDGWEPVPGPTLDPTVPNSRINDNANSINALTTAVGRLTDHVEAIRPTDISGLAKRIDALERRRLPEPVDLSAIMRRLEAVESMAIPVRIETSEGKLIRAKLYKIKRTTDGRLVFDPIVLKFDEAILRGSGSRE